MKIKNSLFVFRRGSIFGNRIGHRIPLGASRNTTPTPFEKTLLQLQRIIAVGSRSVHGHEWTFKR